MTEEIQLAGVKEIQYQRMIWHLRDQLRYLYHHRLPHGAKVHELIDGTRQEKISKLLEEADKV